MPLTTRIRKWSRAEMEKRRMEARNGASNGENNQRRKRRVSDVSFSSGSGGDNNSLPPSDNSGIVKEASAMRSSQEAGSVTCGCDDAEMVRLLKAQVTLLQTMNEKLEKQLLVYEIEKEKKGKKKTVTEVVDMFHVDNCTDSCIYPEEEDIIKALKEEWGIPEEEISSEVDSTFLDIAEVIRGRRNRRSTYVRESLKFWNAENPLHVLTPEDAESPCWHKEGSIPFSRKIVAGVVKKAWNPYIETPGKFTIPQVAYTVAEIEKVVQRKSTGKKVAQQEFKMRYVELCEELGGYIAELKAKQPEDSPELFEFNIGEMIVWTNKDDMSVVDLIRKRKGL